MNKFRLLFVAALLLGSGLASAAKVAMSDAELGAVAGQGRRPPATQLG